MKVAEQVSQAIRNNPRCRTGILASNGVFEVLHGPSGGPEMLALLFADESYLGYWYGHVRKSPSGPGYVALIACLKVLVNASSVPLLFRRFDYWTRIRLEYEPCTIQDTSDAYALDRDYETAGQSLAQMVSRFDVEKRFPDDGSVFASDCLEMRVMDVFGMTDYRDPDGVIPGPPMNEPLRLVHSS